MHLHPTVMSASPNVGNMRRALARPGACTSRDDAARPPGEVVVGAIGIPHGRVGERIGANDTLVQHAVAGGAPDASSGFATAGYTFLERTCALEATATSL